MKKGKKLSIALTSSMLTLGLLTPLASASTPMQPEERIQIYVANTEETVSKSVLIKKFKALFPGKFDDIAEKDFHMNNRAYYYSNEDDTVRYELYFSKQVGNKMVYGSVTFAGDDYEIEHFYYQPESTKDALFPAKLSKDQATEIAADFVKRLPNGDNYVLQVDAPNYYTSRILTEPITYSFNFARTNNGVPIADQQVYISVLGNGEITSLSQPITPKVPVTYDNYSEVKSKETELQKLKDNLQAELKYQVNYDYEKGTSTVDLVYMPASNMIGIHATTGDWLTPNSFSAQLPNAQAVTPIVSSPIPAKQKNLSLDEAKKIAEELLAVDVANVKLSIDSVDEREQMGRTIISVQYMYMQNNHGSGSSLEFDKETGEIIQYNDIRSSVIDQIGEEVTSSTKLSEQQAKAKAVDYLKQYMPSILHNYSMPVTGAYVEKQRGSYYFTFPRIVNNLVVSGDELSVSVASDGTLMSIYRNPFVVTEFPAIEKVLSKDEATAIFKDKLDIKLQYTKHGDKENHYNLVYRPEISGSSFSYIDAITGEVKNQLGLVTNEVIVSHPTAQEQLNYLIQAKLLDVTSKDFNADKAISKAETLQAIVKSLTYFYSGYYDNRVTAVQSFPNIDSKHELYPLIERAVSIGILNPETDTFNPDEHITREELAIWYIRVLGLEQAAKHANIYKLDFTDADKVTAGKAGYVAIANELGLLQAEQNKINPNVDVTYAELAVSMIQLAYEIADKGIRINY